MEKQELETLTSLVKLQESITKKLETYDEYFRKLTNEEIAEIESKFDLKIKRTDKHNYKYPKEYREGQKELKEKYPVEITTIENYYISYSTTNHIAQNKSEIILNQIITQNKTTLKTMAKLAK